MAAQPDPPTTESAGDPEWTARLAYWRRRLGRIRLGVEPVEEQLARYRRVTWMLTAVLSGLALAFLLLFTVFQRPDVGAVLALILLGPPVALAWLDDALLRRRAAAYLRELQAHEARSAGKAPAGG